MGASNVSPFKGHGKDAFDLINEMAPQLRDLVNTIERGTKGTERRDAYKHAILSFCDLTTTEKHADHIKLFQGCIGLALAKAGGTRKDIRAALHLLGVPI